MLRQIINKNRILYYIMFFVIFIGALNKYLTYFSFLISIFVSIAIALNGRKTKDVDICVGIIFLLCVQNFAIGIGAHINNNTSNNLKLLTQIPFINILIIYLLSTKIVDKKNSKWFILYISSIIISAIIGRGSIESILINVRNLTIFYFAYIIGFTYIDSKVKLDSFVKKFLNILVFMFFAGIILLYFGYPLYKMIGMDEVYIAKGYKTLENRINPRFYTTLLYTRFIRMGSLYYEPVNLAYLFAIGSIISILYRDINNKKIETIKSIIIILGLVLTFGKGGYLLVIMSLLFLFGYKIVTKLFYKFSGNFILKQIIIVVIISATIFSIYYYNNIGAAANPHFWGVIGTWQNIITKPIGHGLGTGGNMAQLFNKNDSSKWLSTGGESAIFSFIYQIGIHGGICLLLLLINLTNRVNVSKSNDFEIVIKVLPILLFVIGILQENTFTPQCIVEFMIIIGSVQKYFELGELNEKEN